MRRKLALALLMSCSATLASCAEPKRIVTNLAPPPERLVCEQAGARPAIPPEAVVAWEQVKSMADAKTAHDAYVASVRAREGIITGYIVATEGKLFVCANNAAWLRDWYKATATP